MRVFEELARVEELERRVEAAEAGATIHRVGWRGSCFLAEASRKSCCSQLRYLTPRPIPRSTEGGGKTSYRIASQALLSGVNVEK